MRYVCSDIHGRFDRYKKLLEVLNLKESDRLYILGDVIDRNEDGIEIIKDIMQRKNVKLLMGNHEDFMYTYLHKENQRKILYDRANEQFVMDNTDIWFSSNNGGLVTYKAYKKESLDVQKEIFKFLSELPLVVILTVNGQKYHLSHSGTFNDVTEKRVWYVKDVDKYQRESIVWDSMYRNDTYIPLYAYPEDYVSVVGHVPVHFVTNRVNDYNILYVMKDNRTLINIDSGCALSSVEKEHPEEVKTALSCLCLETGKEIYITDEMLET